MIKGRIQKPGADGAAFFVKFGSLSTMKILPPSSPSLAMLAITALTGKRKLLAKEKGTDLFLTIKGGAD